MRYRDFLIGARDLPTDLRRYLVLFFALVLLSSTALRAATSEVPAPDNYKKLVRKATRLASAASYPEAEAVLRQAIAIDDKRSEAKVELAFVLTKERRVFDAYDMVFPIAQNEPKNARAFAVLGATLLCAGKFRESRLVYYNALKINREEHLAWAGIGLLDFYENDISNSLANLREAVFHAPAEPDYLFSLAQVSARAERYADAADAYTRFLACASIKDADRRERILGLISFLTYLGNSGQLYFPGRKVETTIAFQLVGNRPIVTLRVNGIDEPLRFVLDTGSGISVLSDKTAKRLNIKPVTKGGFAKGLGGDGRFEIVYGLLKQVSLGDVELKNVPVYIRKFQDDSQKIDGYIGLSLISKFLTTVDYGKQTLSLTKRDDVTREFREKGDLSLPLRLTSSGFLSGEVQLEGIEAPLNFIVDTGASVSVISDRVAKAEGISPHVNDEKLRIIGSAGITDDVSTFQLPRVTFGNHTRTDIMAVALNLDLINEASGFEQSGILGGNFLKNYSLTFDFKNSKVIFVPVKPEME